MGCTSSTETGGKQVTRSTLLRPTTFVVVDDHQLFRHGVIAVIEQLSNFVLAGQGESSRDAIELARSHRPSLLLLDVELDERPASSTIRHIKRESPETTIVMLTMHHAPVLKKELLDAGAHAFFSKTIAIDSLVAGLRAMQGQPGAAHKAEPGGDLGLNTNLTFREAQVLRLIAEARTNRDIGQRLSIAEGTVKRHTSSIFQKLSVSSRMEAASRAELLGFFHDESEAPSVLSATE